jgi:histidine triad (HIT) family protein
LFSYIEKNPIFLGSNLIYKTKETNINKIIRIGIKMSETCIFCNIVQKKANASIAYEDDKTMAFMSIQPINVGHTLVIPKKHYENIYEISKEEIGELYRIVKKIAQAVKTTVAAEGIRIIQNNGKAAGQVIFHMHVHIIPMYSDIHWKHPKVRDEKMLDQDAKKIQQNIS